MARFYPGQPVVCVKPLKYWIEKGTIPGVVIPRLGMKYKAGVYNMIMLDYMTLVGYDNDHWYKDEGFAPITNDQVRDIIEEAHRVPSAREYERLMDGVK